MAEAHLTEGIEKTSVRVMENSNRQQASIKGLLFPYSNSKEFIYVIVLRKNYIDRIFQYFHLFLPHTVGCGSYMGNIHLLFMTKLAKYR